MGLLEILRGSHYLLLYHSPELHHFLFTINTTFCQGLRPVSNFYHLETDISFPVKSLQRRTIP